MSINYKLVQKAALEDRVAHLYLFHGSGTEERRQAVLELALMLNCKGENRPCRECPACKKIVSGNHPDVYFLKPSPNSIGIEQILTLQAKISQKNYEGKYKICLIEEADKLTLPAANALLKMAEEPPPNTILVFSTGNAERIIPTLRSRAQEVYFPLPQEEVLGAEQEAFLLSGGDPDLARKITLLGTDRVRAWLDKYFTILETGDFTKVFSLWPLEQEEFRIFLQTLAVTGRELVLKGKLSPQFLTEIRHISEAINKQVNHRLALEVLALKHLRQGGMDIG
ncbi:MAG TPA: DNA polymerase III subunit [Peptococcaceae bacterium]|nr:DNA polymerase III subunit [Peptococcaceae bacterium]